MKRFCYSAGEIEFADTQCDLCIYQISGEEKSCQKFENKPNEILLNEKKCPYVRSAKYVDLDE